MEIKKAMLDVCICTHNPRREIFQIVLKALANQTLSKEAYKIWIIDNASNPPINKSDIEVLDSAGVNYEIKLEKRLGLSYARWCAAEYTQGNIIIFVDDDNELASNYLETAIEIATSNPHIGCFGGKLLLPRDINYPVWVQPMLPYLGIKDLGNKVISNCTKYWGEWEPPGAGVVVRREVLELYVERLQNIPEAATLGHQGSRGLLSCDDSLMMRGAYELGLLCSYQPRLVLKHHIAPRRLKFTYLFKLLLGYGRSHVILESILGNSLSYVPLFQVIKSILGNLRHRIVNKEVNSILHVLCMMAWDLGYFYELRSHRNLISEDITCASQFKQFSFFKREFPKTWELLRQTALKLNLLK